ncbi:MAG TPA: AI-2E family transporter, partial [Lachnospiraceae bacterium]|nr:AI-2E family transporter [Lachnospiraceae bacterium]
YLLASKELFCAQAKKLSYALLREERANNLINNMRFANKTFGGFLVGKILDSLIIGIICFVGTSILKIPYALLISVIVGVTNMIPFFGPYLGAIPCAIILIMINPMKCLIFLIFILILQQFDGNILGPKILGNSTGLSSFWVIFAITIFGGLLGILGMFIGVPLFAVIYSAIKTFVNQRLIKKQLPADTTFYMGSDYHSKETDMNTNSGTEIKFVKKAFDHVVAEGTTAESQSSETNKES